MSEEKNWKQRVLETEIVSGHCPECNMYTILVGLTRSFIDVQIVVMMSNKK